MNRHHIRNHRFRHQISQHIIVGFCNKISFPTVLHLRGAEPKQMQCHICIDVRLVNSAKKCNHLSPSKSRHFPFFHSQDLKLSCFHGLCHHYYFRCTIKNITRWIVVQMPHCIILIIPCFFRIFLIDTIRISIIHIEDRIMSEESSWDVHPGDKSPCRLR